MGLYTIQAKCLCNKLRVKFPWPPPFNWKMSVPQILLLFKLAKFLQREQKPSLFHFADCAAGHYPQYLLIIFVQLVNEVSEVFKPGARRP